MAKSMFGMSSDLSSLVIIIVLVLVVIAVISMFFKGNKDNFQSAKTGKGGVIYCQTNRECPGSVCRRGICQA